MSLDALPVVDTAALPADVRAAGSAGRAQYAAALGFERMLTEQLATALDDSAGSGDGGDKAGGAYASLLPGALADATTSAGGLGLAHELWYSLRGEAGR